MKPDALPEGISTIAALGPWGLVVLVVVVILLAAWRVAGKLIEVFQAQTEVLKGIGIQFAEHKLNDERLHTETREAAREEAERLRTQVAGMVVGIGEDLERAEQSIKAHVATEIKLARAGASSPFQTAVRPPGRGSRPGG